MIPPQFGRVLVSANGSLEAVAMTLRDLSQRFERSWVEEPAPRLGFRALPLGLTVTLAMTHERERLCGRAFLAGNSSR
jgi:hypothetical protein